MTRQAAVHVLAGSLVLLSLALAYWASPWWLALAVFVGANLFQSGLTGFCPAQSIFAWFGLRDADCGSRPGVR